MLPLGLPSSQKVASTVAEAVAVGMVDMEDAVETVVQRQPQK
jgi:hypothetical protein